MYEVFLTSASPYLDGYFKALFEACSPAFLSVHNPPFVFEGDYKRIIVRAERDFMVFKKIVLQSHDARYHYTEDGPAVIPLVIPKGAFIRATSYSAKLRADHAIYDGTTVTSPHRRNLRFKEVPKTRVVEAYLYNLEYKPGPVFPAQSRAHVIQQMQTGDECGPGIHFFLGYDFARNFG
jgi:hypothetical protein